MFKKRLHDYMINSIHQLSCSVIQFYLNDLIDNEISLKSNWLFRLVQTNQHEKQ